MMNMNMTTDTLPFQGFAAIASLASGSGFTIPQLTKLSHWIAWLGLVVVVFSLAYALRKGWPSRTGYEADMDRLLDAAEAQDRQYSRNQHRHPYRSQLPTSHSVCANTGDPKLDAFVAEAKRYAAGSQYISFDERPRHLAEDED